MIPRPTLLPFTWQPCALKRSPGACPQEELALEGSAWIVVGLPAGPSRPSPMPLLQGSPQPAVGALAHDCRSGHPSVAPLLDDAHALR